MKIALVTCAQLPEHDPDESLLLDALRARGVEAAMLAWDDAAARPSAFDLCVLRSTWNYARQPAAFRTWLETAAGATQLMNPLPALRWGFHKGYLLELAERGLPIVPTRVFEQGSSVSLSAVARAEGWDDVVVKPAVSAASYMTSRFTADELSGAGQEWLGNVLRDRDAMMQPYMASVEHGGERALIWIDGMATHAIAKQPRFADGRESVSPMLPVDAMERVLVDHALGEFADQLLYARVDVMADANGAPLISEVEVLEPSLFLLQSPMALARFADAIVARGHLVAGTNA